MADIQIAGKAGGRRQRAIPRIDLTPMVDLGFLLITFFMYTTTMTDHRAMEVKMPSTEPTDHPTAFVKESTLTLIASKGHVIKWYDGTLESPDQLNTCPIPAVRNILTGKKMMVSKLPPRYSPEAHKLHVLIKAGEGATYGDIVALLDEMNIVDIPYYALVDIGENAKGLLAEMR